MERLERLKERQVDVDRSVERFGGNEALYLRFVLKFPEDKNYENLMAALDACDYENALIYAHTLKGVSANLGMTDLSEICADMVLKFRSQEYEGLDQLKEKLFQCHRNMIDAIEP